MTAATPTNLSYCKITLPEYRTSSSCDVYVHSPAKELSTTEVFQIQLGVSSYYVRYCRFTYANYHDMSFVYKVPLYILARITMTMTVHSRLRSALCILAQTTRPWLWALTGSISIDFMKFGLKSSVIDLIRHTRVRFDRFGQFDTEFGMSKLSLSNCQYFIA